MNDANNSGVSERAMRVARIIDRLPPGKHSIIIEKSERTAEPWDLNVMLMRDLRKQLLHKERGEA